MKHTPPKPRHFGIPSGILAREPAPYFKRKKSPQLGNGRAAPEEAQTLLRSVRPTAIRSGLKVAYSQVAAFLRGLQQGRDKLPPDLNTVPPEDLRNRCSQLSQLYNTLKP